MRVYEEGRKQNSGSEMKKWAFSKAEGGSVNSRVKLRSQISMGKTSELEAQERDSIK